MQTHLPWLIIHLYHTSRSFSWPQLGSYQPPSWPWRSDWQYQEQPEGGKKTRKRMFRGSRAPLVVSVEEWTGDWMNQVESRLLSYLSSSQEKHSVLSDGFPSGSLSGEQPSQSYRRSSWKHAWERRRSSSPQCSRMWRTVGSHLRSFK